MRKIIYLLLNLNINKLIMLILIIGACLIFLGSDAKAATYYVDQGNPKANDSNPGTEALPWKTMIHGCARVMAGDTLLVKNGVYSSAKGPEWYIPGIRIANSGTETNPIIIKTYPGHKPIIDGTTASHRTIGTHQASYIIIDGFKILYGIISINESSHITVQNCELVYGLINPGDPSYTNMIEFRYSTFGTVQNNVIHGNKYNSSDGGTNRAAIILHWADDIVIKNNVFYDNIIAYRNKCGTNGAYGNRNLFKYNLIKNCNMGVYMGGYDGASTDNQIEQNIFINVPAGADINIGNIRLIIANNIFYADPGFNPPGDPSSGIVYSAGLNTNPNHQIFNNIIINLKSPISNHASATEWPLGLYCDYNSYSNYISFDQYWTFLTYEQFKSRIGENKNSIINQDPKFINPSKDFHFNSSSPYLNAGIDRLDYNGNGNTTERINMGAYITGNEIIGTLSSPLNPPIGLKIIR
jgi:hypothetical protein